MSKKVDVGDIANEIVLRIQAVGGGTRNNERSSSGAGLLRSKCNSNPRKIAAPRNTMTPNKVTPDLPICCKPKTSVTAVNSNVTMPIGSVEYVSLSLAVSGRTLQAIKAAATATGKFTRKIQRQPTLSMRNPPREGPVTYPKWKAIEVIPSARPLPCWAYRVDTIARPLAKAMAPPTPARTLKTMTCHSPVLSPEHADPTASSRNPRP